MVICLCKNNDNSRICSTNFTCESNGYCYLAQQIIAKPKFKIIKSAGCFPNDENTILHCKTRTQEVNYTCCKEDFCNQVEFSTKITMKSINNQMKSQVNILQNSWTVSLLVLSIILIIVASSLILLSIYERKNKKRKRCECSNTHNSFLQNGHKPASFFNFKRSNIFQKKSAMINDEKAEILESIKENQVNSKLYDELEFHQLLREGSYSANYRAKRNEIDVFVKIYRSTNMKKLWWNEINIYKVILIRHENILNFIAKGEFYDEQFSESICYLTLTEYHPLGSLEHFLKTNPKLSEQQIVRLMLSASSGLNHLHLEISNNQRKPSIVHRNINTKNFIVKQDLTCALANFNHAVKSTELETLIYRLDEINYENKNFKHLKSSNFSKTTYKCSSNKANYYGDRLNDEENCEMIQLKSDETKDRKYIVCRPMNYCPPEYLNNSINLRSIVSLKSADVYSFGLVLWQISNYLYTNTYRMPYDLNTADNEISHELRNLLLEQKLSILDYSYVDHAVNSMNSEHAIDRFVTAKHEISDDDKREIVREDKLSIPNLKLEFNPNDKRLTSEDDEKISQINSDFVKSNLKNSSINSTTVKHQLHEIIREASYIEPLARLSIRKIESDLNKLLKYSQNHN